MKRFILMLTLLLSMLGTYAYAGVSLDLYVLQVNVQGDINAKTLYDNLNTKLWYTGGDTTIGQVPFFWGNKLDLALGSTTSPTPVIPYLSIGYKWKANTSPFLTQIGIPELTFGIWLGYDGIINTKDWTEHCHGGVGVSTNVVPHLF